ncbi:ABC transporter permease [Peptoniphilus sp.]|jgi:oligopeptide transport system permease protein|uniref:ABC transporter permease n=1 Tax=Peptoniphilus sp. TaxID=1971214 RepID=UPI003D903EB0
MEKTNYELNRNDFERISNDQKDSEFIGRPVVTYWSDAWRRFKKNKLALFSLGLLGVIILLVVFGPYINSYSYDAVVGPSNAKPSAEFWFGTDDIGRDIFTRLWKGGRVSIVIGIVGAIIGTVVGGIYGAISGYFGGRVDTIMMRIVEILYSIPYLLLVIIIRLAFNDSGYASLILAMTITGWCGLARLVRGQILSLKEQDFVLAARALGVSDRDIILKHLLPNTLNVILVSISFDVPGYIFSEAFLSYLGLGVQPPNTSWGAMASAAQTKFLFYPYQLFFPGFMIAITMLCFTLIGDGLRDALDPSLRD